MDRRKFLSTTMVASATVALPTFLSASTQQKVRFGLVTDSHYANRDHRNTRYYRDSLEKMEDFVQTMNREKVDFVVHLGDFKDEDEHQMALDTLRYLSKIEHIYAGFNGPRYHCVGNHDVDSIRKSQFLNHITNTGIARDRSFYSFNQKGVHFIVLDANFNEKGEDHFYREGADWQNTNIPSFELDWLRKDLMDNPLPTIVFCHHPLFDYRHDEYTMHVGNFKEVQRLLNQSGNVMAVFQGHVHEERFYQKENIHYVTQYGMVDYKGVKNNSFAIVEWNQSSLEITGYKRSSSRKLT